MTWHLEPEVGLPPPYAEVGLPPPPYGPKTEQIYRREINEFMKKRMINYKVAI